MKTVEGTQLKLGKVYQMPVEEGFMEDREIDQLIGIGSALELELRKNRPFDPVAARENLDRLRTMKPTMVMNPFLKAMEKKYYDRMLMKVKPANYND